MKKMKLKKVLIAALTMAMIMGSSTMAFATADPTTGGSGAGEGDTNVVENDDVFTVVVPANGGTTFDYILNPEDVIAKTDAAKYGNKSFESGKTVYFQNLKNDEVTTSEVPNHYSSKSNAIKAINKSTKPVDIKVTATVPNSNTVTMAETKTAQQVEAITNDAVLYLALQEVKDSSPQTKPIEVTAAELEGTIAETDDAYDTEYNTSTKKYTMQLKPNQPDSKFKSYSFCLTGACSKSSAWKTIANTQLPKVTVTWTVTGKGEKVDPASESTDKAPSIATTSYKMSAGKDVVVDVDLGSGELAATGITSITYDKAGVDTTLVTSNYTLKNGKLTFLASHIDKVLASGVTSRDYKIKFNSNPAKTITVTLAK